MCAREGTDAKLSRLSFPANPVPYVLLYISVAPLTVVVRLPSPVTPVGGGQAKRLPNACVLRSARSAVAPPQNRNGRRRN